MTSLANNADGGSNGTTVTTANSGGGSGTAWDVVTVGTNATNAYDTGVAMHSVSYKIATGGTSAMSFVRWTSGVTALWASGLTTHYGRFYLNLQTIPGSTRVLVGFHDAGVTADRATIAILATGALRLRNAAAGTVLTTTTILSTNTWYRVEYRIDGSTTGAYDFRLYAGDNSVATETITGGTANFGGAIAAASYGYTSSVASLPQVNFDAIQINDTGLPGAESTTQTVTPAGLAVTVGLGSPTISQLSSVTPAGLAVATALGSPTVSQTFTTAPTGLAAAVGLGTPTVSQSLTAVPAGLAVTVGLGSPALSQAFAVALSGIAATVGLGQPTVAFVPTRDLDLAVGAPEVKWKTRAPDSRWASAAPDVRWRTRAPDL